MTTPIAPTTTDVSPKKDGSSILVQWTPVTENNTCNPVSFPQHSDKSIQVLGTFGSASVAVQGSNDLPGTPTNFAALNDPSSTVIAITSAGVKAVLENTVHVKPVPSGGSSQSLTIQMLFHFTNPART